MGVLVPHYLPSLRLTLDHASCKSGRNFRLKLDIRSLSIVLLHLCRPVIQDILMAHIHPCMLPSITEHKQKCSRPGAERRSKEQFTSDSSGQSGLPDYCLNYNHRPWHRARNTRHTSHFCRTLNNKSGQWRTQCAADNAGQSRGDYRDMPLSSVSIKADF